ncbi:MAG TPA: 50S ribosomal protein L37ae [Candidatus Bathyarchaeota archaeon]|nr:50S ribosomal protein L37ae [Candidatus Bathyarchaeota archaeon]
MPKKKRVNVGLRTRGGSTLRKRYGRVVKAMRASHRCPNCVSPSVRRVSVGLWSCRKCGYTFAGGAYTPRTKVGETSHRIRA